MIGSDDIQPIASGRAESYESAFILNPHPAVIYTVAEYGASEIVVTRPMLTPLFAVRQKRKFDRWRSRRIQLTLRANLGTRRVTSLNLFRRQNLGLT